MPEFEAAMSKFAARKYPLRPTAAPRKVQQCAACNKDLSKGRWGKLDRDGKARCADCAVKYKTSRKTMRIGTREVSYNY